MTAESHNTPLLTAEEAAAYLLLTEGRDNGAAVKALYRLCDHNKIRPVVIGKHRRFAVWELDRFIQAETEIRPLSGPSIVDPERLQTTWPRKRERR